MSADKPYAATPARDLEDRVMNVNIAKSEAEWWAQRRIADLLAENERQAALIAELLALAKSMLPANLCVTNPNVRDDMVVPMEVSMGELRKIAAAIAKATDDPEREAV